VAYKCVYYILIYFEAVFVNLKLQGGAQNVIPFYIYVYNQWYDISCATLYLCLLN